MVIAGIVAGGCGSRMGCSSMPKQFLEVGGKPILIHTVEKFVASPEVDAVIIGVPADWMDYTEQLIQKYLPNQENILVIQGGENRNQTLVNIVSAADVRYHLESDAIIVTHDAVRPFVTASMIAENISAARAHGVCGTVIPATDTIIRSVDGKTVTGIPLRQELYQAQTPQTFRYGLFLEAFQQLAPEEAELVTDACKVFHMKGYPVHLVEGSSFNFKITYQFDLKMAEELIGQQTDE